MPALPPTPSSAEGDVDLGEDRGVGGGIEEVHTG
jgi:hypothetical protein